MQTNLHTPLYYDASIKMTEHPDDTILALHGLNGMLAQWQNWAGKKFAPLWVDVDLLSMPASLRGGTMVADYLPETDDYKVRFWGTALVEAFGFDLSGKLLSEAFDRGVMESFRNNAIKLIHEKKPQFLSHTITSKHGVRREFPVLRLPITDDGVTVTKIMTVENIDKCLSSFSLPQ